MHVVKWPKIKLLGMQHCWLNVLPSSYDIWSICTKWYNVLNAVIYWKFQSIYKRTKTSGLDSPNQKNKKIFGDAMGQLNAKQFFTNVN